MKLKARLHHIITKDPLLKGDYTNGEIQNNIAEYGVFVDEVLTHSRLEWVTEFQKVVLNNWPVREIADLSGVKIVKDQPDFVVLFKPSGVVVHPGTGHTQNTLFDWILEHIPGQQELMDSASEDDNAHLSAGLVHRLDKDTAGIIFVAKTLEAHTRLQNMLRERTVEKHYLTVLEGHLEKITPVEGYQARDQRNPRFQKFYLSELEAFNYDRGARFSKSVFTPLEYNPDTNQTLVDVNILTGRMHQIRLHAQSLKLPVLNDPMYGTDKNQISNFEILSPYLPKDKMQLLSNSLAFEDFKIELIRLK
jgi:RluA family pseudouridine synthase